VLSRKRGKVMVCDLTCAKNQVGSHDSIFATQIVANKAVAWISEELPQDSEGLVRRHAIAQGRMRRNASEAKLRHGASSEIRDTAKPFPGSLMVLVIFPQHCHQHVHVQQERHGI
jgi:hypothetical protein